MAQPRKPAQPQPSTSRTFKSLYNKSDKSLSLKQFVQQLTSGPLSAQAHSWFFNKRANFSNPPLEIGSTRKRKGQNGQPAKSKKA